MPVILQAAVYGEWFNATTPERLQALLVPFPAAELSAVHVRPAVNKLAKEGPECIEPAG
jgi:putative SOS response-associated peptidase YedK